MDSWFLYLPAQLSPAARSARRGLFFWFAFDDHRTFNMFSSTVRCGNKLKFWKTNPTADATGESAIFADLMNVQYQCDIANGDGSRFRLFQQIYAACNVVLPEPLGPIIATTSPGFPRGRYRATPSDREIFSPGSYFNGTHFGSLSWRLS